MSIAWNPLDKSANIDLLNDNLTADSTLTDWDSVRATEFKSSGKWYWEVLLDIGNNDIIGVGTSSANINSYAGSDVYGYGFNTSNARKYHSGSYISYGTVCTRGDIIGTAVDLDSGKIWWSKNGAWQDSGDPATGANPAYTGISGSFYPMVSPYTLGNLITSNFGVHTFAYDVPTGFSRLDTAFWSDDVCSGGTCFESSHYSAFVCANAFDDDLSTAWGSNGDNTAWLGYEFADATLIKKLSIRARDTENGYRTPSKFEIRASNSVPSDGSSEGTLLLAVDESGSTFWSNGETHSWEINNDNYYTCYWIYMIDKDGAFGLGSEYMTNDVSMYTPLYFGYFDGYVYEQGNPVQRTLFLHRRDTGALTDTATSSGNGYYYLNTTYSGSHYIVCLDDESGESYNDLIVGNVIPTTTSG